MDTTGLLIALGAALAALAIGLVLGWLAARRLKRRPAGWQGSAAPTR